MARKAKEYDWNLAQTLYDEGYVDRIIAEKLGCKKCSVYYWRLKNDLPSNMGILPIIRSTSPDHVKMRRLYDEGLYDKEIAEIVKCSRQAVIYWRNREGLKSNYELRNEERWAMA